MQIAPNFEPGRSGYISSSECAFDTRNSPLAKGRDFKSRRPEYSNVRFCPPGRTCCGQTTRLRWANFGKARPHLITFGSRKQRLRHSKTEPSLGVLQLQSRNGRWRHGIRPISQQELHHKHHRPDDRQLGAGPNKEEPLPNRPEMSCSRDQRKRVERDPPSPDTRDKEDRADKLRRYAIPWGDRWISVCRKI